MRRAASRDGFALLVTIVLLAFLVLVLVSFASFTRVETRVAHNTMQLSQARQNATLAFSLAMGELQRLAGPDQRASGTAEIGGAGQDGTRAWTGVWGNERASDDYRSTPRLLGWLVSGNENVGFTAETTASEFGRISANSTPAYLPGNAVELGQAGTVGALASDMTLKGGPARLLVGPGSVNETASYVAAPLVDLEVMESTVPGLSGSNLTPIGRYAWWVGDEGVKARLNLVDPWAEVATVARERYNRLQIAQRHGIELMTSDGSTPLGGSLYNVEGIEPARGEFVEALSRTLSYGQARMLPGFDEAVPRAALMRRGHDLTVASKGVLSDQLRGGLRRDLTVLLDTAPSSWTGSLDTSLDSVSATYAGARRIANFQTSRLYSADYSMNSNRSPDVRSPKAATWEQVRSFYRHGAAAGGTVGAVAQSNTQMALFPLIQRWGVSFDVSANVDGSGGRLHIFPFVVLWNPYNVAMEGSYRVRVEYSDNDNSTLKRLYFTTPRLDAEGAPISGPPYTIYHEELIAEERVGSGKYSGRTMEFAIRPVTIPAGQAYVFTPEASGAYDDVGDNWLTNAYDATKSFHRAISHTFTPAEVEYTALCLGNISGGNGGTMSMHLLDASGTPLQLIDAVGFGRRATVNANDGTATQVTARDGDGMNEFRDLSAGPVLAGNQVGLTCIHSLQRNDPRHNWLAQVNQRASLVGRTWFEWSGGFGTAANWTTTATRADRVLWRVDVHPDDAGRTYTGPNHGPSFVTSSAASNVTQAILFNLPSSNAPILSLGHLQHAVLSLSNSGNEPTYAFGNAYATPHIRQDRLVSPNKHGAIPAFGSGSETHLTDVSYLLNHALWDRFFFSGTPDVAASALQSNIDGGDPLPNGRLRYIEGATAASVRDFDRAASQLMVDGAFNVNSASVEAWTALFASLRGVKVNPASGATSAAMNGTPYVRTPGAPGGADTGNATDHWAGYRLLTDQQVRDLAAAMRTEVLARGPFLSLSDFVNRRIVAYPDETGLRGALQAAIDRTNANQAFLDRDLPPGGTNEVPTTDAEAWVVSGETYYLQHIQAPRGGSGSPALSKGAFAPGFLSQADMLQVLGAGLAARSDTFTIRAYGETVNPLLDAAHADYVTSRAWCEAVVQRMPDYVDATNAPEVQPVTGTVVNLTDENQRFGRRFKIVSFRWLTPSEI